LKGSGGLATLGRGESGGGTGEEGGDSELHLGVVVLKKRVSDKSCKRWCGAGFFGQTAMLLSHERGVESSASTSDTQRWIGIHHASGSAGDEAF
jgi:hypothetical protein